MNMRTNTTASAAAQPSARVRDTLRPWRHPVLVMAVVLIAGSALALAIGLPIDRITQIAIYTLYAAGTNFLIGYLGLVPFGASFFFGCASYALAIASAAWGTRGRWCVLTGRIGNDTISIAYARAKPSPDRNALRSTSSTRGAALVIGSGSRR